MSDRTLAALLGPEAFGPMLTEIFERRLAPARERPTPDPIDPATLRSPAEFATLARLPILPHGQ